MSSRLLVLSELSSASGDVAAAIARSQRAKLLRVDPEPSRIEPWQWALASVMVDVERAFAQDLAWLPVIGRVGRRLASGHDVAWALDAVAPRVASLVLSLPTLVDRLDPDHRLAAVPWLDDMEPVRRQLAGGAQWIAVVRPEVGSRRHLRGWRDHVGVVGAKPGAVVVAGVPDRRDAWPRDWARDQRRRADRLVALAEGWGIAAACLPLATSNRSFDKRTRQILRALPVATDLPDADPGRQTGDRIAWRVPITVPRGARDLRVGRIDDALIVRVCEQSRLIPLPSLVARCTIVGAQVRGRELHVDAIPDERRWRSV